MDDNAKALTVGCPQCSADAGMNCYEISGDSFEVLTLSIPHEARRLLAKHVLES